MPDHPFIPERFDEVVFWVRERERIRKAKEAGLPKPWTSDPLLRDYRWCNVSRMDDRVSRELMRSWYSDGAPQEQLVAAALARLVNWPEALLDASGGKPFRLSQLSRIRRNLEARARRGSKVFGAAYVLPGVPGRGKVESTLDLVSRVRGQAEDILQGTLRATWSQLTAMRGLGSFLAGQIGADLAQLQTGRGWPDRLTFAPVGPGSARGINRLYGRPVRQTLSQERFDEELPVFAAALTAAVPDVVSDRALCAQDFQSVLCEADKRFRLLGREGTVRARYDGAGVTTGPKVRDNQMDLFGGAVSTP